MGDVKARTWARCDEELELAALLPAELGARMESGPRVGVDTWRVGASVAGEPILAIGESGPRLKERGPGILEGADWGDADAR